MKKTAFLKWGKVVGIVLAVLVALGFGLYSFYKSSLMVNDLGEKIRRPVDRVVEKSQKLFGNKDESWNPARVMVNTEPTIAGQDWPYYFYATVKVAGQPYYGDMDKPITNEWVLIADTMDKEEVVIHSLFAPVVEGVDHPVVGQKNSFGLVNEIETMFKAGDVVKVYIDKPSIEEALYDDKVVPLAIFVEESK